MNSINRFNGLGGTTVSRAELEFLLDQAYSEQNFEIVERIETFLKNNPDAIKITVTGVTPVKEISDRELEFLEILNEPEQITGLGRAVSPNEIYDLVNNLILDTIKEVGFLPWQKEWVGNGEMQAMNYVTGKPYTGINYYLLNFEPFSVNGKRILKVSENKSPYYLTFNQIEQLGGTLKKGSKGTEVVYYNFIFNYRDDKHKYSTVDATALEKFVKQNGITKEQIESNLYKVPVLKYYKVFSFDDCEGIKAKKPPVRKIEPIQIAENIISFYPDKPKYEFGTDKAFYTPSTDVVSMPKINAFSSEANYYTTFFHEIVHSTGHPKRLARDFSGRFGNEKYAYEELIAELGAVYLSSEAGILFHTRNNSAKYLRGWNARLVKKMNDDNRFFMRAAAEAQKAVNLILDDKKHLETIVSNGQEKTKKEPLTYDSLLKVKNEVLKQIANSKAKSNLVAVDFLNQLLEKSTKNSQFKGKFFDWLTGKTNTIALKELLKNIDYNDKNLVQFNAFSLLDSTIRKPLDKRTVYKNETTNSTGLLPDFSKQKENLEKVNPQPFAIKPKSISVQTAIKDVLSLPKFNRTSTLIASIIYKKFDENDVTIETTAFSNYEVGVLKKDSSFHINFGDEIELLDLGKDFIKAVNSRLESLKNQKSNYAMFDGLKAAAPENPTIESTLQFAEKNLYGKSIYHRDLGKKIHFSKSGIKKAIAGKRGISKIRLQLVFLAKDILKSSRLITSTGDLKLRKQVLMIYKLACFKSINGIEYKVFIVLRETLNGALYYDHDAVKIKKHIKQTGDDFKESNSTPLRSPNVISKNKVTKKTKTTKNKGKLSAPVIVQTISHDVSPVIPVVLNQPEIVQPEQNELISAIEEKKENNPPFIQNEARTLPKKYKTAIDRMEEKKNTNVAVFELQGDLRVFLGEIERKPVHSLAITLDTEEGGGKTHTIYQWANEFYESGYNPVIWSLEEHASSSLSTSKAEKYFGRNISNIPILSEEPDDSKEETYKKFIDSIADFDVCFIDSWNKLVEINNTIKFDQDIRKKFHGKIFIVIVQRTADGKMRGGSSVGFDGDIILKGVVDRADFRNNYIYNHKNRYNEYVPLSELKYSPYHQALLPSEVDEMQEI